MTLKIPVRTCVGCGARRAKSEMLRVGVADYQVRIGGKGKLPGRGCYICQDVSCLERTRRRDRIGFSLKVKLTKRDYDLIEEYLKFMRQVPH